MNNIYQEVLPISRKDAETIFSSGSSENIADALVSLAYYDSDWSWVQEICIRYLIGDNKNLQAVAATCLGHLARIHRKLDLEKVIPLLKKLQDNPKIGGIVEDALGDIDWYLKQPN